MGDLARKTRSYMASLELVFTFAYKQRWQDVRIRVANLFSLPFQSKACAEDWGRRLVALLGKRRRQTGKISSVFEATLGFIVSDPAHRQLVQASTEAKGLRRGLLTTLCSMQVLLSTDLRH
jgi:hypothetical protein